VVLSGGPGAPSGALLLPFGNRVDAGIRPGVPETGISGWPRLVVNQKKAKFS